MAGIEFSTRLLILHLGGYSLVNRLFRDVCQVLIINHFPGVVLLYSGVKKLCSLAVRCFPCGSPEKERENPTASPTATR